MIIQPGKAIINKAWPKVKPVRSEIENLKTNLVRLIGGIDNAKDEEFHKTGVCDFLKNTWYKAKYRLGDFKQPQSFRFCRRTDRNQKTSQ